MVFFFSPVLEELKAGDTRAQVAAWRKERPAVRAICAHILGARAEADDLADEIMTDFLFKYVRQLSREDAMASYLRLMTVRRALRARQQRTRLQTGEPDKKQDGLPVDEAVGWAQLLPRLPRCLEQLTPKARLAIRLRFQGELTNELIGSMIGGSKQYIGRLLAKSMSSLRACLERGSAGQAT